MRIFLVRSLFVLISSSYVSLLFSMDAPPPSPVPSKLNRNYVESVFSSPCDSLSKSVYEELGIDPIKQEEVNQVLKEIGSGDSGNDMGLFQVKLFIDFNESLNGDNFIDSIQLDRTRAYILKKIQEMLCDFSLIISKGKSYLYNENERLFIQKHMQKAKKDFEILLVEFKDGKKDAIKPKLIEYFGVKLSFLADLAENPELLYGRVVKSFDIRNSLDPDIMKVKKLKEVLDLEYNSDTLSINSDSFWKSISPFIKDSFEKYNSKNKFFNGIIPIYSSKGLIGIHTIVYCIMKGYYTIAIGTEPYPVHAGMFSGLRFPTIDHDYQHFLDIMSKSTFEFSNTKNSVTSFYPPIFEALYNVYKKSISKNNVETRKRDMIILFTLLHEKIDFSKTRTFFSSMFEFLNQQLYEYHNNFRSPQIYQEKYLYKFVGHMVLEGIGYVNLFDKIGIKVDFNAESFNLPKDDIENLLNEDNINEFYEYADSNISRILNFNKEVAKNLTNLWYDFVDRYSEELEPMKKINPGIFKKEG